MARANEKRNDIETFGVPTPVPMATELSTTPDRRDEHLETLKCLTVSLKKELNLGKNLEPQIVKIDSYIDCLDKKCAQADDKPSCTSIPPLSRNVKTPQCKLEGSATCYSTGYICFYLQASRQETEVTFKPLLFDVKLFLRHPEGRDPWMVGEKQFILKDNKKASSPQVVISYRDIQSFDYVKDDTITFWWQVWVRENPKEIDLDLTREILNKMATEANNLRELSNDCQITEIADMADGICTMCFDSSRSTEPLSFLHRIDKYEKVLLKNKEIYTPLHESSSHGYRFQGFLLCKEDNSLTAYLYLGPSEETDEVIWPVKIHWRVSLLNQATGKRKIMEEKNLCL